MLQSDQAHVWYAYSDEMLSLGYEDECRSYLSPDEIDRGERFHNINDMRLYLFAHAFLRVSLSRYCSVKPEEWIFGKGEYGRPYISDQFGVDLQFNLTHTNGLVACVITNGNKCGIDAENTLRDVDFMRVSESVCSEDEARYIAQGIGADEKKERFFEFWVLKEAYLKACGVGLAFDMEKVSFECADHASIGCKIDGVFLKEWMFSILRPKSGFILATALQKHAAVSYCHCHSLFE